MKSKKYFQKVITQTAILSLIIFSGFATVPIGDSFAQTTFTNSNPTIDFDLRDIDTVDDHCNGNTPDKRDESNSYAVAGPQKQGVNADCFRAVFEWDITGIPNNANILSTSFQYTITDVQGSAEPCAYMPMTNRPSTITDVGVLFADAGDGTPYQENDSSCKTVGSHTITLGSAANLDIASQLGANWFALAVKGTDETVSGNGEYVTFATSESSANPKPTLIVTYTTGCSPDAPTNLTADGVSSSQINLAWTAPTNCAVDGYQIEREEVTVGGFSVIVADTGNTSTAFSDTNLVADTAYNYRVSAISGTVIGSASDVALGTTQSESGGSGGTSGSSQNVIAITIPIDDITLDQNEMMVVLDTTGINSVELISVTANLPCDANNEPQVKILAGVFGNTVEVIESSSDDTGFAGPNNTCIFRDLGNSAQSGIIINSLILINEGSTAVPLPKGILITLTGVFE